MNRADKRRQKKNAKKLKRLANSKTQKLHSAARPNSEIQTEINRALEFHSAGDFVKAGDIYRRILKTNPHHPVALHLLGVIAHQNEDYETAIDLIGKAVAVADDYAEAHCNLGAAQRSHGEIAEAVESYRNAIRLKPDYATAHYNLAIALETLEDFDLAITSYQRSIDLEPGSHKSYFNLGAVQKNLGMPDAAFASYKKALALKPDYAKAKNNLGDLSQSLGMLEDAVSYYHEALRIDPDYSDAHSNLLLAENYVLGNTAETLYQKHREWALQFAPRNDTQVTYPNPPVPERTLNIGFVSGDLGRHPVGYFVVGLLKNLPRHDVRVFCYSDRKEDDLTRQIKETTDQWRTIVGLSDNALLAQIRADKIDILIDLAGHTAKNRLLALTKKPAPIQVAWAGYAGTTGISQIDYLISDRYSTPVDEDAFYEETIVRMPDGWLCYTPPDYAPVVGPLPSTQTGHITFASFCNPSKLNGEVIAVWSEILHAVSDAKLLIKYHNIDYPAFSARLTEAFKENGIDASRLILEGRAPHDQLLERYNAVDIALDPFPYSGGLTTYEALWMGVPVITVPGATFASRHTESHLATLGQTDFIARDKREYVKIATDLAHDPDRLRDLRSSLRDMMSQSPVCDTEKFALHFHSVLRDMWHHWSKEQTAKTDARPAN